MKTSVKMLAAAILFSELTVLDPEAHAQGGVPQWTNRHSVMANGFYQRASLGVDLAGNVFVAGSSQTDYETVKYTSAGMPLRTNRYNGPANGQDVAAALAVDSNGNVFVTGFSYAANGHPDFATVAYSEAGAPLWTNRYNGPGNAGDEARAMTVDNSGHVVVTGFSAGINSDPYNYDFATVAYSGSGVALWTNRYNGPGDGYFIRVSNAPEFTYRLQRAPSVTGPWSSVATNTAPASGPVEFHDTSPLTGQAFYRTVQP